MGRIFFSDPDRVDYFSTLKKISLLSWGMLARELGVSDRQFRDWRQGVASFPESIAELVIDKFNLELPEDIVKKEERWHLLEAAKLGGKRHSELYGSPGTPEGRRKGGLSSIKTHRRNNTRFIVSKFIRIPDKNVDFSELIGALLGDGGLTVWQMRISLNLKTDRQYATHLMKLTKKLFNVSVFLYERKYKSTLEVTVHSNKLVKFLKKSGLPIGNKLKQGLDIPRWIYENKKWEKACLRGLFDTDGCTYIDHHVYKNSKYGHIGIVFISYSASLVRSIIKILNKLGYSPTISDGRRIFLRREHEVLRFFKEIKPSNKRHNKVLNNFLEEYRSGCNGSASKADVVVR